ncbi:hypothetical protein [uncultured Formosa sp.]|uniref:hypothetical protein n=1 Tax=uncultured Formosa sp. TaxID=255435 RepID=UPI0026108DCC|nr:hypothetical protein [uncultured Formosa sp.]
MKKIFFILTCIALTFYSCNNDDDIIDCFTPPTSFTFELVDKTTGENLFTNGTYNANDISLTNTLDKNSNAEFTFIDEDNYNIIEINSIGWKTEIVNFELKIEDEIIFNLYVDAERKSENHCSFTTYNEIEIQDTEYTLDNKFDFYTILIP